MAIDFKSVESKWQARWKEEDIFQVFDDKNKRKYYILEMFPYPSGSGLHMGHAFNYTIGDIYARFKRMQGFNVLYPMGYDAFGLPAENAAIKVGVHPADYTNNAISNFVSQQNLLGLSYDWSRIINTSLPSYYKWDQWIFLKMLEKKIAYRKKAPVNWCSECKSVLANEQVHDGKCWRHNETEVETRSLEQWFFKITDYADELLKNLDILNWPARTKIMQKNWIGKSFGVEILFGIEGSPKKTWKVFTTRPDTIFGVTFMVVSAQHPRLMEFVKDSEKSSVEEFLRKFKGISEKNQEMMNKEGVFTGSYAINPVNGERIPIYAGNFVLADYGSGMIMAVPAHDKRDFEFAEKYSLPIKVVIEPKDYEIYERNGQISEAYVGEGFLVNSEQFNGMDTSKAREEITKYLLKKKLGRKEVQFKLRDWLVSRQRYWGTPIPIIYCENCGMLPVPEKDLPVMLPLKVSFGEGNPLETNEEWIRVKCHKCGKEARRETDTLDTFVNSSWYFLRYCDPDNSKEIFSKEKADYWMPIDQYIGGAEHACMHLVFFRFYTKFLRDIGLLKFDEPAKKLFHQGMLHGEDNHVMSKSRGNVVDPLSIINKFGADSLRMFLVSMSSPDKDCSWSTSGLESVHKFLKKVADYFEEVKFGESDAKTESKLNKTIKEVTEYIGNFKYNLAVIKVRELFNFLPKKTSKEVLEKSLKLLHPFCPHLAEEFWEKIGGKGFISLSEWPVADEKKINEYFDKQEQATEKLVSDILNILKIVKSKGEDARKVYVYVLPGEKDFYELEGIDERIAARIKIYEVSDSEKYDPKGISKKAKPGKPGIYVE